MSGNTALIIFILALILTFAVGIKTKINMGVFALAMAYFVGVVICGQPAASVSALFPANNLFIPQVCATLFFGFAVANGTIKVMCQKIIGLCKGRVSAIPPVLLLTGCIIGALGGGVSATPFIMSPIAFALAAQAGFDPMFAAMTTFIPGAWITYLYWTDAGSGANGMILGAAADGGNVMWVTLILMAIGYIIWFGGFYLKSGIGKVKRTIDLETEDTAMNGQQKFTLTVIVVALCVLIIPGLINIFAPNPVTQWISSRFDIKVVFTIGALILGLTGAADFSDAMKNIPFNAIILISGMAMYMSVGKAIGAIDALGGIIGDSVPGWLLPVLIFAVSAIMSFLASALAVWQTFLPLCAVLASATGANVYLLITACMMGGSSSAFSPVSAGGAGAVVGADEKTREGLFLRQWKFAVINCIVMLVVFLVLGSFMVNLFF